MLFVTGLATLIALYASEYMSHDVGQGYNRFFAYFALFVFATSVVSLPSFVRILISFVKRSLESYCNLVMRPLGPLALL
jgi:NADH:ubiquinone oxidoreductase subunit 5 (subunit L)/multisubunit Na+/H+ antiporter MnhA subunit